jgi:hypothetical protein
MGLDAPTQRAVEVITHDVFTQAIAEFEVDVARKESALGDVSRNVVDAPGFGYENRRATLRAAPQKTGVARVKRVYLDQRDPISRRSLLAGLSEMARPRFELGTPRFPVAHGRAHPQVAPCASSGNTHFYRFDRVAMANLGLLAKSVRARVEVAPAFLRRIH